MPYPPIFNKSVFDRLFYATRTGAGALAALIPRYRVILYPAARATVSFCVVSAALGRIVAVSAAMAKMIAGRAIGPKL